MTSRTLPRVATLGVLLATLVLVLVAFGIPANHDLATRTALAIVPWLLIAGCAWHLGRDGYRDASPAMRARVHAAFLLLAPFALFSLMAGFGPPWYSSDRQNVVRFVLLALDAVLVGAGLMTLARSVEASASWLAATLAPEAVRVTTILYLVFTVSQIAAYRAAARGKQPAETFSSMDQFSVTLLMTATPFVYLATAAIAAALARDGVLGRAAGRAIVGLGLFASACIAVKLAAAVLLDTEPLWTSAHAFTLPGFVLSIPAVPWMVPCGLAVALLWRSDRGVAQRAHASRDEASPRQRDVAARATGA